MGRSTARTPRCATASLIPPASLGLAPALALELRPSVLAFAAAVALGTGLLYAATGSWTWPLLALTGISGVTAWLATVVGRPRYVEDSEPGLTPRAG